MFYDKLDGKGVKCRLCPHECVIADGKSGICLARANSGGVLYSLSYGEVVSVNLDPIEKKPLYHFYPGSRILSVGSLGCNFKCGFCQNWEISQNAPGSVPARDAGPEELLETARKHGSIGIAYTYNEPLINYEWVKECSQVFRKNGLKNVLVTNGYINGKPLEELLPFIDAANIDVKSFDAKFYEKMCRARLKPVLETVKTFVSAGKHVEITDLLIPDENTGKKEIEALVNWIASLSPDIPLHFSRYFPSYKSEIPATEIRELVEAYETAKEKLHYVYIGNIMEKKYNQTLCPECKSAVVGRNGHGAVVKGIKDGKCAKCGKYIAGVWWQGKSRIS